MNLIIIIVVLALDQLSKLWAVNRLQALGSVPVIENIFHLTYVENRGAAFGMLQNQQLFFIITTSIIIVGALVFMYKNKRMHLSLKIGLNLVVAGAIGNFIDRIRLGFVVDFFDFRVWPVFNIADCAVVVGAIVISYVILKYDSITPEER
ncbi:signal peptidase II [Alkaliphilus hydrothermalis]|uniref:Lipoprotein signal peptidase n=1 Tax=Alkaliphilus hydrothermalis TaxID=1482730 RepID=A0ABS2NPM4_9FIRM|nr:signal peptidase II [Alkaliphilus hydrothermalis]MBM7614529.1 signal peptidase II [Alkaliphilus hydrothermalis]